MSRRARATLLAAVLASACSTEAQICGRMDTLCGTGKDRCHQLVQDTREALGDDGVAGLKRCFAEATSCAEASGCTASLGVKALGDALKGFFRGLGGQPQDPPAQ